MFVIQLGPSRSAAGSSSGSYLLSGRLLLSMGDYPAGLEVSEISRGVAWRNEPSSSCTRSRPLRTRSWLRYRPPSWTTWSVSPTATAGLFEPSTGEMCLSRREQSLHDQRVTPDARRAVVRARPARPMTPSPASPTRSGSRLSPIPGASKSPTERSWVDEENDSPYLRLDVDRLRRGSWPAGPGHRSAARGAAECRFQRGCRGRASIT